MEYNLSLLPMAWSVEIHPPMPAGLAEFLEIPPKDIPSPKDQKKWPLWINRNRGTTIVTYAPVVGFKLSEAAFMWLTLGYWEANKSPHFGISNNMAEIMKGTRGVYVKPVAEEPLPLTQQTAKGEVIPVRKSVIFFEPIEDRIRRETVTALLPTLLSKFSLKESAIQEAVKCADLLLSKLQEHGNS